MRGCAHTTQDDSVIAESPLDDVVVPGRRERGPQYHFFATVDAGVRLPGQSTVMELFANIPGHHGAPDCSRTVLRTDGRQAKHVLHVVVTWRPFVIRDEDL